MARFTFTRPAIGAAPYGSRSAKLGTLTGTVADAVRRARALSNLHGGCEVYIAGDDGRVASVAPKVRHGFGPLTGQETVALSLPPEWVDAILG